ncbi:MAG: type IV toxin-antitoxin system AbiEi family antitoxin [Rhodanobacter sp.]
MQIKVSCTNMYNKMKATDLHHHLQSLGRRHRWCVSDATLRCLFPEPRNTFYTALSRQVRQGTLKRITPGLYLNPYARPPASAAETLAGYLRPDDFAYLSLESALHEHGWMSQVPNRLTFMTTGASYVYTTPVGVIEFTHTARDMATWRSRITFDRDRMLYVAAPELALEDLKNVGRNLDLVDIPEDSDPASAVGDLTEGAR